MNDHNHSPVDQILDLLLDALQERQTARQQVENKVEHKQPTAVPPTPTPANNLTVEAASTANVTPLAETAAVMATTQPTHPKITPPRPQPAAPPPRRETIYLGRMLGRLFLALIAITLLVNIPFNRHGTSLARAMPDSAALIVRDGLLLKGSGDEVYVLENNQRRWIATLDAFTYYGYRWENVHEVDDAFIAQFEEGRPLYLLVKCSSSPHVYALEDGQKRWIKDIPTFETLGVPWSDIQIRSCQSLRGMPDGVPIPADAGEPPQP